MLGEVPKIIKEGKLDPRNTCVATVESDLLGGIEAALPILKTLGYSYTLREEPLDDSTTQIVITGEIDKMEPAQRILPLFTKRLPTDENARLDRKIAIRESVQREFNYLAEILRYPRIQGIYNRFIKHSR